MLREMLVGKLHRAAVTDCKLDYAGSLGVDADLIDQAHLLVHQKVQVYNVNNGARWETYLVARARGLGEIVVLGAAARLAQPGDRVIIVGFGILSEAELATYAPTVLELDERNRVMAKH